MMRAAKRRRQGTSERLASRLGVELLGQNWFPHMWVKD